MSLGCHFVKERYGTDSPRYAGGDNKLAVIMSAYKPTSAIRCSGAALFYDPCEEIVLDMPATTEKLAFGPPTDPTSKIPLPYVVESGEPTG